MRFFLMFFGFLGMSMMASAQSYVIPKIWLNQVTVLVDDATFEQFATDDFLKDKFAHVDRGLPNFDTLLEDATALYIRGENTSLKIIKRTDKNQHEKPLSIGFSIENKEEYEEYVDTCMARLKENISTSKQYYIDVINYYKRMDIAPPDSIPGDFGVDTWVMCYQDDILNLLYPGKPLNYKRNFFLSNAYDSSKLVKDIVQLDISMTPEDARFFLWKCGYYSFGARKTGYGYFIVGKDLMIRIRKGKETKLNSLTFMLNKDRLPQNNYKIGDFKITNGEKSMCLLGSNILAPPPAYRPAPPKNKGKVSKKKRR